MPPSLETAGVFGATFQRVWGHFRERKLVFGSNFYTHSVLTRVQWSLGEDVSLSSAKVGHRPLCAPGNPSCVVAAAAPAAAASAPVAVAIEYLRNAFVRVICYTAELAGSGGATGAGGRRVFPWSIGKSRKPPPRATSGTELEVGVEKWGEYM